MTSHILQKNICSKIRFISILAAFPLLHCSGANHLKLNKVEQQGALSKDALDQSSLVSNSREEYLEKLTQRLISFDQNKIVAPTSGQNLGLAKLLTDGDFLISKVIADSYEGFLGKTDSKKGFCLINLVPKGDAKDFPKDKFQKLGTTNFYLDSATTRTVKECADTLTKIFPSTLGRAHASFVPL